MVDKQEKKSPVDPDKKYFMVTLMLDEDDLEHLKFELAVLQGTAHFAPESHVRDQLLAGVIIAAEEGRDIIKLKGKKKIGD